MSRCAAQSARPLHRCAPAALCSTTPAFRARRSSASSARRSAPEENTEQSSESVAESEQLSDARSTRHETQLCFLTHTRALVLHSYVWLIPNPRAAAASNRPPVKNTTSVSESANVRSEKLSHRRPEKNEEQSASERDALNTEH